MSRSTNPYQDDRGNKDRSITREGGGDLPYPEKGRPEKGRPENGREAIAAPGGPFLAAETMTGG